MCFGFALKSNELKTKFVDKLVLLVTNLNIDVTLPPTDKPEPILGLEPTIARATAEQLRE